MKFLLPCCRWILASCCAGSLFAESDSLETVEKSAGEWLKVRAETSRIETEWSSQRQLMESMVHGLTERAQLLESKLDYLRIKTARDRDELAKWETDNKSGAAELQSMDEQLKSTDSQLLQLRRSLPPRLSAALALPYKSLAGTELPVGERMQLTITVLNRSLQFNRGILVEDEVVTVEGAARQMEVIYWGLSHGYALDRPSGKAWHGSPGPEGWRWEAIPDGAERVSKLIAIYRGKGDPEFVAMEATSKNQVAVSAQK